MGHFGRPPIVRGWPLVDFPACILSYMGQGALVLKHPSDAVAGPFFLLVPEGGRLPRVLLATAATVIASQAVLTGAFSVAYQAVQLGCHNLGPTTPQPKRWGRSSFRGATGH
jgi:KUP system potassium uptake protein